MKKTILLFIAYCVVFNLSAQIKTDSNKVFKNEFGVDATSFIKYFLPFSQSENYAEPTYYLTYRRKFNAGNLRSAIGSYFLNSEYNGPYSELGSFKNGSVDFDVRLGWEFTNDLSKKWQVYYGLDARYRYSMDRYDVFNYSVEYLEGKKTTYQSYGLAPFLGFRFKLTKRLSLTTETFFVVCRNSRYDRTYFTPTSDVYPSIGGYNNPKKFSINGYFSRPTLVIITFDI